MLKSMGDLAPGGYGRDLTASFMLAGFGEGGADNLWWYGCA